MDKFPKYDPHIGMGHPRAERKDCPWCNESIEYVTKKDITSYNNGVSGTANNGITAPHMYPTSNNMGH